MPSRFAWEPGQEKLVLPYADEPQQKAQRFPFITILLLLINVAIFVYMLMLGEQGAREFVERWGFVPSQFWAGQDLETLITAIFLHGGLLHIFSNMLFLWIFGDNVEDQLGHWTYLLFYIAAGIVASVVFAVAFANTDTPLVGASGAIAGVLGAYLLLFPRAMIRALLFVSPFFAIGRVAAIILIGVWFLLQIVQTVFTLVETAEQTSVAFLAHVAGFVFGLAATGVIRQARDEGLGNWHGRAWMSRSARNFVLLVVGLIMLLSISQLLLQEDYDLAGGLLRLAIGAIVVAIALFDGLARLRGRRALLGNAPRTNRIVALIQIFSAVAIIAAVITV